MIILWWVLGIITALFILTIFFGAPYVPSRRRVMARAFDELYPIKKSDFVVDVGSGDGRVLRYVSNRGAHAIGYEINPVLALISRLASFGDNRVTTKLDNLWRATLPLETTLVYVFAESRDINRIATYIQHQVNKLDHPIYVLSYAFELDGYKHVKRNKSHLLYKLEPLHPKKAQV